MFFFLTVHERRFFVVLQILFVFLFYERTADARVHVLRAKVRIMQEELDQLSREYYKKVKLPLRRFKLTCLLI